MAASLLTVLGFSAEALQAEQPNREAAAVVSEAERPPVAVLGFAIQNEAEKADALTMLLEAELTDRGFKVVDRRALKAVLDEQAMGVAGMIDPAVSSRLGRLSGAKVLIGGRLLDTPEEIVFSLRLTNTETAEVKPANISFKPRTPFSKIAASIADRVVNLTKGMQVAAPEQKPVDTSRVNALIAMGAGRELPEVAVSVPEFHIGRRIPDPAAETEIMRLLQKIGFTVVKGKGVKNPPPLRVEGEAFSEFGMQAGHLVSCRARVEIKVVDTSNRRVLFVDDKHASGVDVSEHVAAKAALRKAGEEIAPHVAEFLLKMQ